MSQDQIKPDIIKVSLQADIVEVIEVISSSSSVKVVLTLPKPTPKIFKNLLSMRLLKLNAKALNKETILVTDDKVVQNLAKRLEIQTKLEFLPVKEKTKPIEKTDFKLPSTVVPPTHIKKNPISTYEKTPIKAKKNKQNWRFLINLTAFALVVVTGVLAINFFVSIEATINIKTDVSSLRVETQVDLSQKSQGVDIENQVLPLKMIPKDNKLTQEIEATGSTDGQKAKKVIDIHNCDEQNDLIINAQTIFRKDNLDFVWLTEGSEIIISPNESGEECGLSPIGSNNKSLTIEAAEAGEEYNLEPGNYQIVGQSEGSYSATSSFSTLEGSSSASCITPNDLAEAKEKFSQIRKDEEVKQQLIQSLKNEYNLIPLATTFQVAEAEILEPATCPEVTNNQLSQVIVYYLGGIKSEDVSKLIESDLKKAAGDLNIRDDGVETATYSTHIRLGSPQTEPTVRNPADLDYYVIIKIDQAIGGIALDEEAILDQVAGGSVKQAASKLRRMQGVESIEIDISPSWVVWARNNLPQNKENIIFNIDDQAQEDEDDS